MADQAAQRQWHPRLPRAVDHLRPVLDALPGEIALVARDGTIVAVNAAWEQFSRTNGGTAAATGVGTNYLAACGGATEEEAALASEVRAGLEAVLQGAQQCFVFEYPCHLPAGDYWFRMQVRRPASGWPGGFPTLRSNSRNPLGGIRSWLR